MDCSYTAWHRKRLLSIEVQYQYSSIFSGDILGLVFLRRLIPIQKFYSSNFIRAITVITAVVIASEKKERKEKKGKTERRKEKKVQRNGSHAFSQLGLHIVVHIIPVYNMFQRMDLNAI